MKHIYCAQQVIFFIRRLQFCSTHKKRAVRAEGAMFNMQKTSFVKWYMFTVPQRDYKVVKIKNVRARATDLDGLFGAN
jgi:hypothetical protein